MSTEHDTNDPRVSAAYRDVANEKTPPELDRKVLAMAASEARTRYGLARFWIRPVAWAATIGLSLAFILEMSEYADTPIFGTEPDTDSPIAEEQAVRESPSPVTNGAALVETESKDTVQEAATAEGTLMLQADDMSLLRDAEKQARARAGEALPAAAPALAPRKEKYRYCDEETRESAASWYECIAELRAQGLADAASAELGALQEAFPDFRQPARQ
jgi:hypothetical protein